MAHDGRQAYLARMRRDGIIIALSVVVAVLAAKSGLVLRLADLAGDMFVVEAFFAGAFFTSVFTTAPASVMLGALAEHHSPFLVALLGAAGSLVGDLIIFRFFRERLSGDFEFLLKQLRSRRIKHLMRLRAIRWLMPLLGGLVIASPLPDELGILILGLSRMPRRLFIPLSYAMNFLGILVIGYVARGVIRG